MKKVFIIIGAVIGIIIIFAAAAMIFFAKSNGGGGGIPAEITEAKTKEMVSIVQVKGNVELKKPVRIYASNNGRLDKVLVTEGDYVKKGEVLFTYDKDNTDDINNQLTDARLAREQIIIELNGLSLPADESEIKSMETQIIQNERSFKELDYNIKTDEENLAKAKKDYNRAKDNFDKNKRLFDAGVIAENELRGYEDALNSAQVQMNNAQIQLEKDKLSYSSLEAEIAALREKLNELVNLPNSERVQNSIKAKEVQLEQAEQRILQLENELSKYKENETAPFDGRVSAINQNDGATVLEDTSVLEMVNEHNTVVYVDIPESEMAGITEGLDVLLSGDGFNGEIKGKIKSIKFEAERKEIDNVMRNVVEAELEIEDKSLLRPGYTLKGKIIKAVDKEAVVIPVMAYLTDDDGKDYVFIVNDENRLEKRFITIKDYSDMEISIDGVEAGERLLSSPNMNNSMLTEGALIMESNIKNENETETETAGEL